MNWRRFFFENYTAKLALLLMAIFLWFFVVTSREYDQMMSVPLRLTNLKEEKVLLEDPPATAEVRFRGKGTSLLLLGLFGDVHLNLSLSTISYYYDYPTRLDQVKWAPGISVQLVEIINPDTVHIRLDDEVERSVQVKPMLSVLPADEHILIGSFQCAPDTVLVRGPKSIVEDLKYIPTQVKSVENATGSVNSKLDLIPPEGASVSLEPSEVRVSVKVEKVRTKEILEVPVNVIHCLPDKPGYSEPASVNIKVKGAKSLLEDLSRENIMISVSARSEPDSARAPIPIVHLPEGIELVELIPDTVRIIYLEAGIQP